MKRYARDGRILHARGPWVALLAMTLVAAACGGDDGGGDSSDASPTTGEGEPQQGGEMVVATLFDSFGFDPVKTVGGVADGTVTGAVFDSLMTYDEDNEIVPQLAEALETTDQQTWTLRLRPDVTFTDGTPLDAEAVKFNIERHQDISLLSRAILNALNIEAMTVVDPTTLEIRLAFPWPAFPETLVGALGVVGSPTALADPEAFNTQPVGAGPFMLAEWVPGDHITLERNPDYWNAANGEPHLDQITFRLLLDTETRINSVQGGEVHLAQSTNGAEILNADDDGMVGFPVDGPGITVQMNGTQPPFNDPRVRQAVLQATDREALFNVVFEGAGTYPPNNFIISNDSEYAPTDIEYPEFDADAARALVDEYEAENGPISFTYNCHNQPDLVNMSQVVQQMWSDVGMDVEVQIKDQQTLVGDIFDKNYQISCFGAVGQEDPDLAYYGALHSASPTNSVGYSNPEVDAALETGRQSADPEERRAAYAVVQQALATDVPLFRAVTSPWGWFGSSDVGGMFTRRNATFNTAALYIAE